MRESSLTFCTPRWRPCPCFHRFLSFSWVWRQHLVQKQNPVRTSKRHALWSPVVLQASTASQEKMGVMVPREKRENQVQLGCSSSVTLYLPDKTAWAYKENTARCMQVAFLSTTYYNSQYNYSSDSLASQTSTQELVTHGYPPCLGSWPSYGT